MLDSNTRGFESLNVFKNKVLKFIRPKANSFFNCLDPKGVKLITSKIDMQLSNKKVFFRD